MGPGLMRENEEEARTGNLALTSLRNRRTSHFRVGDLSRILPTDES